MGVGRSKSTVGNFQRKISIKDIKFKRRKCKKSKWGLQ